MTLLSADPIGRVVMVESTRVRGFSRDPLLVWILRDGNKNPERYHMCFWEPA